MRVRRIALGLVAGVALALPSVAAADVVNFWGFNHMNSTNPGVGYCSSRPSSSGIACAGWNYWDRTQIEKNSGDYIAYGFLDNDGSASFRGTSTQLEGTFTILRTDAGATTYNRSTCAYQSGAGSYLQCRAIIF